MCSRRYALLQPLSQPASDTSTKSFTKPTHSRRREAQSSDSSERMEGAAQICWPHRGDIPQWGYWKKDRYSCILFFTVVFKYCVGRKVGDESQTHLWPFFHDECRCMYHQLSRICCPADESLAQGHLKVAQVHRAMTVPLPEAELTSHATIECLWVVPGFGLKSLEAPIRFRP